MGGDSSEVGQTTGKEVKSAIGKVVATSTLVAFVGRISTALSHSVVGRSTDTFRRVVRTSALYRWATEAPDEITVDLNHAVFGPFGVRLLAFATQTYPAAVRHSTAIRRYKALEETVASAPLQFLGIALFIAGTLAVVTSFGGGPVTRSQTPVYAGIAGVGVLFSKIRTPWSELSNARVVTFWLEHRSTDE